MAQNVVQHVCPPSILELNAARLMCRAFSARAVDLGHSQAILDLSVEPGPPLPPAPKKKRSHHAIKPKPKPPPGDGAQTPAAEQPKLMQQQQQPPKSFNPNAARAALRVGTSDITRRVRG